MVDGGLICVFSFLFSFHSTIFREEKIEEKKEEGEEVQLMDG